MSQQTFICLLRGINVSGKNKIKMVDLKESLAVLDFQNIVTYIQSGNVIFESKIENTNTLERKIKALIKTDFGYDVPAMVFSKSEFEATKANNPFYTDTIGIKSLHVTFITSEPTKEQIRKLKGKIKGEEQLTISKKSVYLHCPHGYGRTKLNNNQIERTFNTQATTRNWKTVLKLSELSTID